MSRLEEIGNIVKYGLVDYYRLTHGINKTTKCPVCGHRYNNQEDNICPVCNYELEFISDILYPDEPSAANHDISLRTYKRQYLSLFKG